MKRLVVVVSVVLLGALLPARPAAAVGLGLQVDDLPSTVRIHSRLYLTGTAPLLRTVVMQVRRGSRWTTIAGPSAAGARFAFRVPTGYFGVRVVRVVAPASGLFPEADGAAQTVHVHTAYTPAGRASQHVLLGNGYRWNPCRTVPYRVNLAGLPSTNLRLIRTAFHRVTEATGIHFSYAGATTRVPFNDAWSRDPGSPGLFLAFATSRNVPALAGSAGLGGESLLSTTSAGSQVVLSGGVALDKGWWRRLEAGFVRGTSRGSLLLHEIGHTLGLMHPAARSQVMYATLTSRSYPTYGRGDLAGLEKLGLDQGCLP